MMSRIRLDPEVFEHLNQVLDMMRRQNDKHLGRIQNIEATSATLAQ